MTAAGTARSSRHRALSYGFLVSGIAYLDRVCISAAAPCVARGSATLISTRLLFGTAEAGSFPAPAGTLARWLLRRELDKANGVT